MSSQNQRKLRGKFPRVQENMVIKKNNPILFYIDLIPESSLFEVCIVIMNKLDYHGKFFNIKLYLTRMS